MKKCRQGILFLSVVLLTTPAFAQQDSIDLFINKVMQQRKIPGLQLAVVRSGKIVKAGNYGLANVQDSIPVMDKTVFSINSITKAFTGVAIMELVEAGKLKLSSPVSSYLDNLPAAWTGVTIQHLLSHTSGIPDIVDEEESVLIHPDLQKAWEQVLVMPNDFQPGEKFSYNQTNYLLLGKVIDRLSAVPFAAFISSGQLQKAGMPRTILAGFGASKEVIANAACSYRLAEGKLINMFFSFPPSLHTAAGMSSTATEMARWIISLQDKKILQQPASLKALWTPAVLNNGKTAGFSRQLNGYAAGWPVATRPEHPAAAAVGGGRSALFVYPQDDLSVVVLTNLSGSAPDTFIDEIAGFLIPGMKEANGFGLSQPIKQIRSLLEKGTYKHAIAEARTAMKKEKAFVLEEEEVNSWGYKLLSQKRAMDALEIFKLNVFLYPGSSNAFDSLGEIYAMTDNKSLAIFNYEQALRLDPQNRNAQQQLFKLKDKK